MMSYGEFAVSNLTSNYVRTALEYLRPEMLELRPHLYLDESSVELDDHVHGAVAVARVGSTVHNAAVGEQRHHLVDQLVLFVEPQLAVISQ